MKTLFLVRHAKSSWTYREKRDIERPLKDRGVDNANLMASHLKKLGENPEYILSSPAVRAHETAKIFHHTFALSPEYLDTNQSIYSSSNAELFTLILSLPDTIDTAMLFGHQPSMSSFAEMLTGNYIEHYPTSAVTKIIFDVEKWKSIKSGSGKLQYFLYPKMLSA